MKQSILDKLAAAIAEPDEAVDPTLVIAFMSAVLTAWKNCRNPAVAKAQTLAGGPVAYGQAIRIVRQETDLRGKAARLKAMALVVAGTELTPDEIAEIESEAADVPTALPFAPVGIFQFLLIISCILMFAGSAQAQSGIFQIDVEQNRRLDILEKKLDDISNRIGLNTPTVSTPAKALQAAPVYEIINGVPTHTSDAHLRFHGYTDQQLQGLTQEQKDRLHGAAHAAQRTVTVSTVCNGRNCRRLRR